MRSKLIIIPPKADQPQADNLQFAIFNQFSIIQFSYYEKLRSENENFIF
jgi:hypothetical protein